MFRKWFSHTQASTSGAPGWALIMRSPYACWDGASSWLGGAPVAPADFVWPRDKSGDPQLFLAQIDLAALTPEPETGQRPPGLPEQGALLVFAGETHSCFVMTAAEMAQAKPVTPPDDLAPADGEPPIIQKLGYFGSGTSFTRWAVDPVAYFDTDGGRPADMPDRFTDPAGWIVNWGIAAFEADMMIRSLEIELESAQHFFDFRKRQEAAGDTTIVNDVVRRKSAHYTLMQEKAPSLLQRLKEWRTWAAARDPLEQVDPARLEEVFAARLALRDTIDNYAPRYLLPGNAKKVWDALRTAYPAFDRGNFDTLPEALRPFVEACIVDWRGHRLFGLRTPPPFNNENLQGRDCLILVHADRLLGNESEHEHAMSVWCPRAHMARGRFDTGVFLRHGNG